MLLTSSPWKWAMIHGWRNLRFCFRRRRAAWKAFLFRLWRFDLMPAMPEPSRISSRRSPSPMLEQGLPICRTNTRYEGRSCAAPCEQHRGPGIATRPNLGAKTGWERGCRPWASPKTSRTREQRRCKMNGRWRRPIVADRAERACCIWASSKCGADFPSIERDGFRRAVASSPKSLSCQRETVMES